MRAAKGVVCVREQRSVIVERDVVDGGITFCVKAVDSSRNPWPDVLQYAGASSGSRAR